MFVQTPTREEIRYMPDQENQPSIHNPSLANEISFLSSNEPFPDMDDELILATLPRISVTNDGMTLPRISITPLEPSQSLTTTGKIFTNFIVQSIGKIFGYVVAIVTLSLTTRLLNRNELGDYTILFVYLSVFNVLADSGIMSICVREAAKFPEQIEKVLSATFVLKVVFAFLSFGFASGVVFLFPYQFEVKLGVIIVASAMFFSSVSNAFDVVYLPRQQSKYPTIGDTSVKIILLVGTIGAFYFRFGLSQSKLFFFLVSINAFANIVMALIRFVGCVRQVPLQVHINWSYWKYLFSMSIPMGVLIVLGQIHFKADAYLLSFLQPPSENAIYGIAYKIIDLLLIFFNLFASMILPILARASHQNKKQFHRATQKVLNISIVISFPISVGVFILAPQIINLINPTYPKAILPLQILSLAVIFMFVNMLYSNIAIADNYQNHLIWVTIINVIANVSLNWYAIPIYSYNGSAVATDITEGLGMLLVIAIVNHYHAKTLPSGEIIWKTILACGIMILSIEGLKLLHPFFSLGVGGIVLAGIGGLIYCAVLYAIRGIDPDVLALVEQRISRLRSPSSPSRG